MNLPNSSRIRYEPLRSAGFAAFGGAGYVNVGTSIVNPAPMFALVVLYTIVFPLCGVNVFAVEQLCVTPLPDVSEQICGMKPVIGRLVSAEPLFWDTLVPAPHAALIG